MCRFNFKSNFQKFLVIFVDGGSIDNSVSILEDYKSKDSCIKIIKQQNQHAGVARNNDMKEASGKYLFFLDSDDFFEPNMFEKCVEIAEKTSAEIVGYNSYGFYDKRKNTRFINNLIIKTD